MGNKKIPLKIKFYMMLYPLRIFIKSLTNKFFGGEKMGNFNLKGKKAVVFGVANDASIAWHIAKALNDNGVRIALAYQERAEQLVKPLLKMLDNPLAEKCDVVDDVLLTEFFNKVENEFGKVDFLVHSIAFAKKDHLQGNFYDVDRRGYQVAQEVSSYSLAELTRRVVPMMNDNGSVIAMTYYGAEKVVPNYNVMGVAKAALEASARYIASDLGSRGIRVNTISAGPIKTLAASGIGDFDKMLIHAKQKAPLKRNINADDVANMALFLCSDMSKNITGQVIYVDAGYSIMAV
ncbi:MAG TPA: enoyl-ACP reductase [Candidatus Woesearchaeota archaeon]|jgi:enoyl-[acyl-carrier protein] reductase I|nr:enoyl-ACP reductase [Candidatus Woesearchaeota archaeon]|tara:strand:+ start:333 stop:1208 length:876 start_codon:yes stop_codon:yes gene_type:complete